MFEGATALEELYRGTVFAISDTPAKTFWTLYTQDVNLYVDGGNFTSPYYNITNEDGEQVDTLDLRYTYTFYRLNDATSHPFYISDNGYEQESSNKITLTGDGSATSGITGTQSFTLTFNGLNTDFTGLTSSDTLTYYCTAHSNMEFTFNLIYYDE